MTRVNAIGATYPQLLKSFPLQHYGAQPEKIQPLIREDSFQNGSTCTFAFLCTWN